MRAGAALKLAGDHFHLPAGDHEPHQPHLEVAAE